MAFSRDYFSLHLAGLISSRLISSRIRHMSAYGSIWRSNDDICRFMALKWWITPTFKLPTVLHKCRFLFSDRFNRFKQFDCKFWLPYRRSHLDLWVLSPFHFRFFPHSPSLSPFRLTIFSSAKVFCLGKVFATFSGAASSDQTQTLYIREFFRFCSSTRRLRSN